MKKLMILLVSICISIVAANAQSPAPEPDTLKEVKQTDPEAKNIPHNNQYTDNHIKITSKQIPASIRKTLEGAPEYRGWEKGTIYKDKSGQLYTLEITKSDTTRTYRFDSSGKPVKE